MKRFSKKKVVITSLISIILLGTGSYIYCNSIPKEEPLIGAYIDGTYSETLPSKGKGYAVEKIVCDNNKNASWDYDKWGIKLSNWGTRSRCNIYFKSLDIVTIANKTFYLDEAQSCPSMNSDGTVTVTGAEDTCGYLCKAKDAYGDSYYFRGNVTNNYVLFGGFYWRIIRMNGDGSVRVIYDGTTAHANGESSTDRQIGTSAFNSSYNDNAYVGYMYGKVGSSTYAETHANTNNSTIKTYIDTWYENNIKGTSNEKYIIDNIFCNDRSFASNNSGTGAGKSETYYRWYDFVDSSNNNKMMLTCPQKNDAFTVNDTSKGNGALTYGIGLVTIDEVVLGGGWSSNNSNYYLYTGQYYWASSPIYFRGGYATGRTVHSSGNAVNGTVRNTDGVRPVISLSSEILGHGDGTTNNPYRLTENIDSTTSKPGGSETSGSGTGGDGDFEGSLH